MDRAMCALAEKKGFFLFLGRDPAILWTFDCIGGSVK